MADIWSQRSFSSKSQFPLARSLTSLTTGASQGKQCVLRTHGGCDGESAEREEMGWEWLSSSDIRAPYSSLPRPNNRDTPLGVVPGKL